MSMLPSFGTVLLESRRSPEYADLCFLTVDSPDLAQLARSVYRMVQDTSRSYAVAVY